MKRVEVLRILTVERVQVRGRDFACKAERERPAIVSVPLRNQGHVGCPRLIAALSGLQVEVDPPSPKFHDQCPANLLVSRSDAIERQAIDFVLKQLFHLKSAGLTNRGV